MLNLNVPQEETYSRQGSSNLEDQHKICATSMLDDLLLSSVQQSIISVKRNSGYKQGSIVDRRQSLTGWRNSLVSKARELEQRNMTLNQKVQPIKKEAWPSYEAPVYYQDPTFKQFLAMNQVCINEGTGYMFMRLEKDQMIQSDPVYFGGETVRGSIFFELFHPSVQHELFVRLKGVLIQPKKEKFNVQQKNDPIYITKEDFKGYQETPRAESPAINIINQQNTLKSQGFYNVDDQIDEEEISDTENIRSEVDIHNLEDVEEPVQDTLPKNISEVTQIQTVEQVINKDPMVLWPSKSVQFIIPNKSKFQNTNQPKVNPFLDEIDIHSIAEGPQSPIEQREQSKSVLMEGGQESEFSESEEFDSDEEDEKKTFYSQQKRIFQFRSGLKKSQKSMVKKSTSVSKGQYVFPFTISLPKNSEKLYPSAFQLSNHQVKWTLEVSFNEKFRDSVLSCQRSLNLQFPMNRKQSFIMQQKSNDSLKQLYDQLLKNDQFQRKNTILRDVLEKMKKQQSQQDEIEMKQIDHSESDTEYGESPQKFLKSKRNRKSTMAFNQKSRGLSFDLKRTKSLKLDTQLSKIQEEEKSEDSGENVKLSEIYDYKEKSMSYLNLHESYAADVQRCKSKQEPIENFFEEIQEIESYTQRPLFLESKHNSILTNSVQEGKSDVQMQKIEQKPVNDPQKQQMLCCLKFWEKPQKIENQSQLIMFEKVYKNNSCINILLKIEKGYKNFDLAILQLKVNLKTNEGINHNQVLKSTKIQIYDNHSMILRLHLPEDSTLNTIRCKELRLNYSVSVQLQESLSVRQSFQNIIRSSANLKMGKLVEYDFPVIINQKEEFNEYTIGSQGFIEFIKEGFPGPRTNHVEFEPVKMPTSHIIF